jgi:hypothetical protein
MIAKRFGTGATITPKARGAASDQRMAAGVSWNETTFVFGFGERALTLLRVRA